MKSRRDPRDAADVLPDSAPSEARLAIERGLLGACLLDPDAIPLVLAVPPEVFVKDAHRDALEWMRATHAAGEPLDDARLARALEAAGHSSPMVLIASMIEAGVPARSLGPYVRDLREDATKALFARRARELALGALANGDGPPVAALLGQLDTLRDDATALLSPGGAEATLLDAAALRTMTFSPRPALVAGLIERESLVLLLGAKGRGKTALTLGWLCRQALGLDWLGFPTEPARALVFEAELQPAHLQQRLALLAQDLPEPIPAGMITFVTDRSLRLDTPAGQGQVRHLMSQGRPELVAFDPLARYMVGHENDPQDMGRVVAFVDELIQRFGVTVLIVAHTGKPVAHDPREGGHKMRGHSALYGAADSVLLLERQGPTFTLSVELRHAPERPPLTLQRTDHLWFLPALAASDPDVAVVCNLAGAGRGYSDLRTALIGVLGCSRAKATRLIARARDLGEVVIEDGDYKAHGLSRAHARGEP
jgi:hypothetical protein